MIGSFPGRQAPRSNAPRSRRTHLAVETLEARDLMTAAAGAMIDPAPFEPTRILVQFRTQPKALAGTRLGDSFSLVPGLHEIELNKNTTVADALAAYRSSPRVLYAQPDYRMQVQGTPVIPDDPRMGSLWGMTAIGAPEAWGTTTGTSQTIVAVIDSGVDYRHPDLAANMWVNPGEIAGNRKDDDGNGFIDDVYGYDFANNDANPMDDNGHGTHVAGTIGAVGNNGIGVAGVNWAVRIMALKFMDRNGNGYTSDAIRALNYAVSMGAAVSNNSWGGGGYDQALERAIRNARSQGHIFVAAAGNDGSNNDHRPFYPAGYNLDNIITVAAVDRSDRLAGFSNYGAGSVDIAAPGVGIWSTTPNTGYASYSGTSMAAPHVTGVVALVRGLHQDWTYRQIIDQVLTTADTIAGLQGKVDGGGRLNAARAVGSTTAIDTIGPRITAAVVSTTWDSIRLSFSEPIQTSSISLADLDLPGLTVASVVPVPGGDGRQVDLILAQPAAPGAYRLAAGPNILDLAGNPMDQDQNGTGGEVPNDIFTATVNFGGPALYESSDTPRAIRDWRTTVSTIQVKQDLIISDLNIKVNITHDYVGDLYIHLRSPAGTDVALVSRRGKDGSAFLDTLFDDEAAAAIRSGRAPFAGSFRPEKPLSALDGQNAKGVWQLWVEDKAFDDEGSLNSWSLMLEGGPQANRNGRGQRVKSTTNENEPQTDTAAFPLAQEIRVGRPARTEAPSFSLAANLPAPIAKASVDAFFQLNSYDESRGPAASFARSAELVPLSLEWPQPLDVVGSRVSA